MQTWTGMEIKKDDDIICKESDIGNLQKMCAVVLFMQ